MGLKDAVRKDFKPSEAPTSSSNFLTIPPGWYTGIIEEAEVRRSDNGNGNPYLNFRWRIQHGPHAGRVGYDIIMLDHPKEEVRDMGEEKLGALCQACGFDETPDESELLDKSIDIRLKKEKDAEYGNADGFRNRVAGFRSASVQGAPAEAPVNDDDIPF